MHTHVYSTARIETPGGRPGVEHVVDSDQMEFPFLLKPLFEGLHCIFVFLYFCKM